MPDPIVPGVVLDLVERFECNRHDYRSGRYNETQARREFIDPLFKALGWDVDNERGYAETYKDVIHEDAIRVGSATGAPDYCFRIGGTRKFFVEAKKPSVSLKDDISPAYQLRRYAWSAKLPLGILTDFEELAVFDCRLRPNAADKASTARTMYLTFDQYPGRWPELAEVFGREAVLRGSFDRYVESNRAKRGTAEVDAAFLQEISTWRDELARNLALRNPALTSPRLNYAVQQTIDRIIFLRIAEDRGLEPYGRLLGLVNGGQVYERLCDLYRQADERYNSGLFHFHQEKGRAEAPDLLSYSLVVDDKVLAAILKRLYYPESPYAFAVLPVAILGQVYEQFLGKVIRLTAGHQAKVEEKPEVKKAGGVYYTPAYIVEYIVKHTIGALCEGKTPAEVARVRIVDPACGSGSFLIGAYEYLLRWHLDWYSANDPERWARRKQPPIYLAARATREGAQPSWELTIAERKRILLDNIYGVDIDAQAVEVTKLSLLLKVLEGQSVAGVPTQLAFLHERALPDLGSNIQCGNSLIGPDYYEGRQASMFDPAERDRVNAFDWHRAFPHVFAAGGFDAVIGNPPYGAGASEPELEYYRLHYAGAGSTDSYALFLHMASSLLTLGGCLGMIVQSGWTTAPGSEALRRHFANAFRPVVFASMPYDVFGAYVDTVVVVAERARVGDSLASNVPCPVELVVFPPRYRVHTPAEFAQFAKRADASRWLNSPGAEYLVTLSDLELGALDRVVSGGCRLSDVADIQRGVTPFAVSPVEPPANGVRAFDGVVRRYVLGPLSLGFIRYDETLAEYKPSRYFCGPRLLLRELISRQFRLQAVYASDNFVTNKSMQSILLTDGRYSLHYLLGILNSRLLSWYALNTSSVGRRDDFPKIVLRQTRALPLPAIEFGDPADVTRHDRMVALVEQMLALHKQVAAAKVPGEVEMLQRQIEYTDRQIDLLVYELYGLSDAEIAIVEGEGQ